MTEFEWMICTDQIKMLDCLKVNDKEKVLTFFGSVAVLWCNPEACEIVRCIVGNPFHPIRTKSRVLAMTASIRGCCNNNNTNQRTCDCWDKAIDLESLLTWNNGIIPLLAQAIHDGTKCERCLGRRYLGAPAPGQHGWIGAPECPSCKGIGRTGTYDQDAMLVLADAVEEAGGPAEIVDHLREHKKVCDKCKGTSKVEKDRVVMGMPVRMKLSCDNCKGTGSQSTSHYPNCHAVTIFLPQAISYPHVDFKRMPP